MQRLNLRQSDSGQTNRARGVDQDAKSSSSGHRLAKDADASRQKQNIMADLGSSVEDIHFAAPQGAGLKPRILNELKQTPTKNIFARKPTLLSPFTEGPKKGDKKVLETTPNYAASLLRRRNTILIQQNRQRIEMEQDLHEKLREEKKK